MTTIRQNDNLITQINQLEVEPRNQQRLVELMTRQARNVMAKLPGFISINLHQSLDGTRVVNYAQWESQALLDAAHADPAFVETFKSYKDLVIKGEPHLYRIVYSGEAAREISEQADCNKEEK